MVNSLEQFCCNVRNFSATGNFEKCYEYCIKNSEILVKNSQHLDDALANLDLQEHSLGILNIIYIKNNIESNQDHEAMLTLIEEFINGCNGEQIRFATETFAELCHSYTSLLIKKNCPIRGLNVLNKAISKIQFHNNQLTSIHADFCQLCILSKCFKPALYFLNCEVNDISKESGQFDVKYFLLYYYYGGIIYAALKNYRRALFFFEIAITTPSLVVSMIMVEAYKKYILVALILDGKVPPLPKYTSQIVSRLFKHFLRHYNELALAYSTNNSEVLSSVIARNRDVYIRDINMGLVKQCLVSLHKKNIQRLTKTFLTLSLSDMASRVQLSSAKEAEAYILRMIEENEIFASINQKDGMVVFLDNPEKYNTSKFFRRLEKEMKICIQLDENLKKMNHEIAINPKYIQKMKADNE